MLVGAVPGLYRPSLVGSPLGASSKSMRGYFLRSCSCGRCRTLWLSPGFTETILPRRESSFFRSSSPMGRAPIARSSAIAPPCWRSVCCPLCSGLPGPSIFWSHLCLALGSWRAGSVSPWSQRRGRAPAAVCLANLFAGALAGNGVGSCPI